MRSDPTDAKGPVPRPRSAGVVYTGVTLVLVAVIGLVALTATQPPPPTIAEFAPQAVERIEEAPSEQTSAFGAGEGGLGTGGAAIPTPPPVDEDPPAVDVPRIRRCIGDPPRQIEDPQSPPCVPYWDGDNGGNTWRGVTGTEIIVARPGGSDLGRRERAYVSFFNRRFELYGRRITLVPLEVPDGGDPDPAAMSSDAEAVDAEIGAFASLSYPDRAGVESYYYDHLARRNILSVAGRATMSTETHYGRMDPYQWNYLAAADTVFRNLGEWYCGTLAGRPARHAGSGIDSSGTRKLGVIVETAHDGSLPDVTELQTVLDGCSTTEVVWSENKRGDGGDGTSAILRLSTQDVTTVLCLCHQGELAFNYMVNATSQGFFPEWLVSTYLYHDSDVGGQTYPAEHRSRAFGISFMNKALPPEDMPRYWAAKEADPEEDARVELNPFNIYKQLLLLASGIQMAGPDLNPEALRDGLFGARFPNPGCGGPPYYQACVDFGPRNHTMNADAATIWFDPSARSYQAADSRGAWCYLDAGRRFHAGAWPQGEQPLFEGNCR